MAVDVGAGRFDHAAALPINCGEKPYTDLVALIDFMDTTWNSTWQQLPAFAQVVAHSAAEEHLNLSEDWHLGA